MIEYKSPNGYTGVLYGKSSMIIYDADGKEVLHTGSRTPNTLEELKEVVEKMPKLMRELEENWDKPLNTVEEDDGI
jgi:hypothetical protein